MNTASMPTQTQKVTGCQWSDIPAGVRFQSGLLNGLLGFFVATTLGWTHVTWHLGLLTPLVACFAAGAVMAVFVGPYHWRKTYAASVGVGIALIALLAVPLQTTGSLIGASVFSVLVTAALGIQYVREVDVSDACAVHQRTFSIVTMVCLIVYIIADAFAYGARSRTILEFVVVVSCAIIAGQLTFTRYVQNKSTQLGQNRSVRYAGAGMLTLFALITSFGPIVAFLWMFVVALGVSVLVAALIFPLIHVVSHRHPRPQPNNPATAHMKSHLPPHVSGYTTTDTWAVWLLLIVVFLGIFIFVMLRSQAKKSSLNAAEQSETIPTTIRRERLKDTFRLQETTDTVRKAYQQQLRKWHEKGRTIARAESPRELLSRLPREEANEEAARLTARYEETRYGKTQSTPED